MLSLHYLFSSISRSWKHHTVTQLVSVLVLVGTFTIISTFYLFFNNLENLVVSWGSKKEINVYLNDQDYPNAESLVAASLDNLDAIQNKKFISKREASKSFFARMNKYVPEFDDGEELIQLIPASYRVTLKDSVEVSLLPALASQIMDMQGVSDVSYGREWLNNFSVFVKTLNKGGWAVIIVLILGSLFVVSFCIKSILVQRRNEIEILELVGATAKMIRIPYVVEGAFLGLLSSSIAIVICFFVYQTQSKLLLSELSFWGLEQFFTFFKWYNVLGFVAFCTILSSIMAFFCARKINTGWAATQREAFK